ncbi:Gfo/Idh/MocA family oxidoreductase [Fictibacillus sp. WQ 8-8]|uniref:Gfo/Idh/MocA family protein n=1 Tax=Fictibacillus sp. WQ 8-8 TaxID=2938788 RepID=UPI00210E62E8|nr:Gfo/Idh/MocA family oxidoreductase [Fictibacillus sp. WQ 8-8]MCQ6264074.1 Gfo/Idh/MocA family oxidoreductase [Fictibacillus sp. WQ 8-8]
MEKKIRFAIIGCGVISDTHQAQIQSIEGAELVAVADHDEQKARMLAEKANADWYVDYKKMLERDDIDVVNVLTPSGLHAEMTVAAARAGKHVICEKPLDTTLEKARKLVEECRKANVKLSIISQHRFDPSTIQVKQLIEDGKLGNMVLGQAAVNWYRSQEYYDSGEWRGTWKMDGGGALMNQSIHTIDLLQYFMGPVESVYAHTATLAHERIEVEDVAVATIKFKNGSLGTISGTTSAFPGLSARLEVFGTAGTAVIDNDILTNLYLKDVPSNTSDHYSVQSENLANSKMNQRGTGATDPGSIEGNSHRLQLVDMIEAIKEDREPLVNGEEGIKPLEIILAIYESANTGKPVEISSFAEFKKVNF